MTEGISDENMMPPLSPIVAFPVDSLDFFKWIILMRYNCIYVLSILALYDVDYRMPFTVSLTLNVVH